MMIGNNQASFRHNIIFKLGRLYIQSLAAPLEFVYSYIPGEWVFKEWAERIYPSSFRNRKPEILSGKM